MFQQDFKNNLKNKIIYNRRTLSNIFDFIEVAIDLDNKLYKRAIKKNTINFEKEQKSFLNQQLNISRKNLVLIRNTVTPIIVNLYL